jgi:hypothetical protein
MAHRADEKEARRQERLAKENADKRSHARKKRVQMVLGGLLTLALIAGVAVFALGLLDSGDDEKEAGGDGPRLAQKNDAVKLPGQVTTNLEEAVEKSGCKLEHPKYEGAGHEERPFTTADYKTNPPTSGTHFPTWYDDGIYSSGDTPELGQLVHTLEHGRVNVQYKPGTPADTIAQLEAFVAENGGYHMLMYENTTKMDAAVAATAWTHLLTCSTMKPEVFDALRTFRDEYLDKGPEQVP